VRFASVYRRFEDVDSLEQVIGEIKKYRETRALEDVQPRLIPN
jgi:transcriptional regulator NrdR family protein